MSKKDKFLYSFGVLTFAFFCFVIVNAQNALREDIKSNVTEIRSQKPLLAPTFLRYELAGKILLVNSSRKNIAFLIGTLMTVFGSLLVISKIESYIDANVDTFDKAKIKITTTSPGVFIVFLGTVIILVTIFMKDSYKVEDGPITAEYALPEASNQEKVAVKEANEILNILE